MAVALCLYGGCTYKFEATLVPDGKPQEVKCTIKPDYELPRFPNMNESATYYAILKSDLMSLLYNPAIDFDCEY